MDTSPHKSDFVNVNGIRLHYLDWGGSGPALLFLAGRGCNAHIFDGFAPRFTDHFRVLALTRRGHGESDYPETGYDINTLTEDIRQSLDHLNIGHVILAGHSMAGIEVSHFTALYPERVRGLVYFDAAYDRSSPECKAVDDQWPLKDVKYPDENGIFDNFSDLVEYVTKNYLSFADIWCEALEENWRHQMKVNSEGKWVYKGIEAIEKGINETLSKYQPEDAKIYAPILNIYAIKDNTYFVAPFMTKEQKAQIIAYFDNVLQPWNRHCIEQFRQAAPHAKIVEIPHSHHYPFLKDEERVFKEMMAFLLDR